MAAQLLLQRGYEAGDAHFRVVRQLNPASGGAYAEDDYETIKTYRNVLTASCGYFEAMS